METTPSWKKPVVPTQPRSLRRLHQERCGYGRIEYDGYADVREACERKLAEWERQGTLALYRPIRLNDWLFRP